jgi:ATP adenylyltransferase
MDGKQTMQHLWSPWRKNYIENHERKPGCVFCMEAQNEGSPESLVVFRGQRAFVILNRYPYTNGHLMIVSNEHLASLQVLDAVTRAEMMELVNTSTLVLGEVYHPEGFNIGINLGSAAGAGIVDHIHIHVVPRWMGDTNFMSALGETRVIPEDLGETQVRLKNAWPAPV